MDLEVILERLLIWMLVHTSICLILYISLSLGWIFVLWPYRGKKEGKKEKRGDHYFFWMFPIICKDYIKRHCYHIKFRIDPYRDNCFAFCENKYPQETSASLPTMQSHLIMFPKSPHILAWDLMGIYCPSSHLCLNVLLQQRHWSPVCVSTKYFLISHHSIPSVSLFLEIVESLVRQVI